MFDQNDKKQEKAETRAPKKKAPKGRQLAETIAKQLGFTHVGGTRPVAKKQLMATIAEVVGPHLKEK